MTDLTNGEYACRVDLLDDAQRLRWRALRETMHAARPATRELPDGYVLRFDADPALFLQVAEWITLERHCCPFLAFGLEWSDTEGMRLRLTGGLGVKEFLARALPGNN